MRSESEGEDECKGHLRSPLAVACAFFMAELGDKTQLCALTLAARYQSFLPVWLGASAGMILAISLAIGVGYFIGSRIPEAALKWLSASVFAVFGIITLITALQGL
jgi:putative Ca2+/H+ antiporter (TMEM165/GDT1 family)